MEIFYPLSDRRFGGRLKGQGTMQPGGVTVHYTADRDLLRSIQALESKNLAYHLIIDRQGTVFQMLPFDRTCYHAGKASWHNLSPNSRHIAVAFLSWGQLRRSPNGHRSWSDVYVAPNDVRTNGQGAWDAATDFQEAALKSFLRWACLELKIDPDSVCGHDECAIPPGRKVDPGGSLSFRMADLRKELTAYVGSQKTPPLLS